MSRERLSWDSWPAAVYAIGDVHGCLAQLLDVEHQIVADAQSIEGEKWLVTLGDHIDRGPDSAGVINHLMGRAPPGFHRLALLGNHEQIMLDFLEDPTAHAYWLDEGGAQTLISYGIDLDRQYPPERLPGLFLADVMRAVPEPHLRFIRSMPLYVDLPGWLFVHAGIRPGIPLASQETDDLIWIREPFLSSDGLPGKRIVHGHTPVREPVVTPARIGIDTRCFATGRLSALRVTPDGSTRLLNAPTG
jgi:serine/threonine protein phosphatase 1